MRVPAQYKDFSALCEAVQWLIADHAKRHNVSVNVIYVGDTQLELLSQQTLAYSRDSTGGYHMMWLGIRVMEVRYSDYLAVGVLPK